MDKEFTMILGAIVLTFLFVLPSWSALNNKLEIQSVSLDDRKISFSVEYSVPWPKSCFIVAYGPFAFGGQGFEEGNNIFVLSKRTGTLTETLTLKPEESLISLKLELWCDNNKLLETEGTL